MAARTNAKRGMKSFSMVAMAVAIAGAGALMTRAARADLTWDSSGVNPAAPVDGLGNWDTSSSLWSNGSGDVVWPNDTTVATFGSNNGVAGTVTLTAPITAGGLTFNAPTSGNYLLAGAVAADTLTLSGATPTVTVNGAISPTITAVVAGTNGLTMSGNGTLILSGANTYSGNTLVSSGQLQTTTATGFGNGTVVVAGGGTANANSNGIINNAFNITGNGSGAQLGALVNQNHSETYAGLITLTGNARIGNGGFTSTFTGGITGNASVEFFGNSSGNAIFKFNNNVAPAGVYNWTGNTTITAAGAGNTILQFGASTLFPSTSTVTLNATSTGLAEFDMTGRSETIAGLISTGNGTNTRVLDNSTGNGTLTVNNAVANTFAGIIASGPSTGTMILTKTGVGTLTLTNANTYAGNTTVSGGTLSITGSLLSTGIVNVNTATLAGTGSVGTVRLNAAGATISPGAIGSGSPGTLTMAGLTTTTGGAVQADLFNSTLPATNDAVVVNSAVNFTVPINIVPSAGAQAGNYTVMTAAAGITYTVTPTLVTPTGIRPGTVYTLVTNPTNVQVQVTGGPASVNWAGGAAGFTANSADSATWDNLIGTGAGASNDENFNNTGVQDFYYDGDNVTFADVASPNYVINLTTNVFPGSVTFNNAATYAINGVGSIAGSGAVSVSGTGTVVLNTANTYSGGTSVNAGATLQVGDGTNASAAIGSGPISVAGTLAFDYNGNPAATANALSGNGSILLPTNGNSTFTLHWTGNNTGFVGNVSIGAGNRLEVSGANANLGTGANVNVQNGGAFYSNGSGNFAGSISIAGSGWSPDPAGGTFGALRVDGTATTFSGPVTLTGNAEIYVTGAAATISGNISDGGGGFILTKAGSNFLIVSGTNSYSGGTTIANGTLQLASATALPAGSAVTLGSAIALGSTAANASGTLDLNGFNATLGGLATSGTGTANIIGNSSATAPSTLIYAGGNSTFSGKIVDTLQSGTQTTALSVTSGNLTLSGANTYTGNTSVNSGASLTIAAGGSVAATTNLTNNGTVNFNNPTRTIATLNSTTGGAINLNTTVLTVTTGGSYVGTISDAGTGGGVIVPVGSVLSTGSINANSLEVDGKQAFANTTIRTLSKVNTLTVAGSLGAWTGSLDLTSSRVIVEDASLNRASDLAAYKDMVANNLAGTVGIFSSTAAANGQVVVVSDNAVRLASFGAAGSNFGTGIANVDASSILLTAAVPGDANLDGVVDIKDLQDLANHWQQPATDWSQADFDGNGVVALQDLQALANHWQNGVGAPGQGSGETFSEALSLVGQFGGTSSVPEPMSLAVLSVAAVSLMMRRRRSM